MEETVNQEGQNIDAAHGNPMKTHLIVETVNLLLLFSTDAIIAVGVVLFSAIHVLLVELHYHQALNFYTEYVKNALLF